MALILDQPAISVSSLPDASMEKTYHENLITDLLLANALQAILAITDTEERMRARQMRERGGFTLTEALQVLRYLHHQGILGEELEGRRVVNRELANNYLSILAPAEALTHAASEETPPFSREQIAWACVHARDNKLTAMRLARPSRWTIALAQVLGLVSSDIPGELIFSTSRARRLCSVVEKMSESERASYVSSAQSRLQAKKRADDSENVV